MSRAPRSPGFGYSSDERSSGEYERSQASSRTPLNGESTARNGWSSSARYVPPSNSRPRSQYFSHSVLEVPGNQRLPSPTQSGFTRGRCDWSEQDEEQPKQSSLRRMSSVSSALTAKSRRRQSILSTETTERRKSMVLRVGDDSESVYQGRGCTSWFHH